MPHLGVVRSDHAATAGTPRARRKCCNSFDNPWTCRVRYRTRESESHNTCLLGPSQGQTRPVPTGIILLRPAPLRPDEAVERLLGLLHCAEKDLARAAISCPLRSPAPGSGAAPAPSSTRRAAPSS